MGRDDIGALVPGMSADFIAINIDTPFFAGAHHDITAALMFCSVPQVDYSIINGEVVVRDGQLTTIDLPVLLERHNAISKKLMNG